MTPTLQYLKKKISNKLNSELEILIWMTSPPSGRAWKILEDLKYKPKEYILKEKYMEVHSHLSPLLEIFIIK